MPNNYFTITARAAVPNNSLVHKVIKSMIDVELS